MNLHALAAVLLEQHAQPHGLRAASVTVTPAALVCPSDPVASEPQAPAPPDAGDVPRLPRAACSYAVRDVEASPLDDSPADDVLAACIHHPGGANVAYANGSVRFLTLAELGVADDDDKTVGPASTSPVLRAVHYGDGSVR